MLKLLLQNFENVFRTLFFNHAPGARVNESIANLVILRSNSRSQIFAIDYCMYTRSLHVYMHIISIAHIPLRKIRPKTLPGIESRVAPRQFLLPWVSHFFFRLEKQRFSCRS